MEARDGTASGGRGATGGCCSSPRRSGTSATSHLGPSTRWSAADVIACEDTRRTGRLLEHAGVAKPRLLVVNDHTEPRRPRRCSTCSTPGERSCGRHRRRHAGHLRPGRACWCARGRAPAIGCRGRPGPSAAIAALVVSGLPTGRFVFEGFLPAEGIGSHRSARRARGRAADDRPLRGAAPRRRDARRPRGRRSAAIAGSSSSAS